LKITEQNKVYLNNENLFGLEPGFSDTKTGYNDMKLFPSNSYYFPVCRSLIFGRISGHYQEVEVHIIHFCSYKNSWIGQEN